MCAKITMNELTNMVRRAKMKFESRAVEDIMQTLRQFNELEPKFVQHIFPDKVARWCISISGTIPILYKGSTYHIPIALYLMDNHPYSGPFCYVCPTETMRIRPSETVDDKGRIYLPYLTEWRFPGYDTCGLLQVMTFVFQDKSPMYSISSKPLLKGNSNSVSTSQISGNHPPYSMAKQDSVTPYPNAESTSMPQPNATPYPLHNAFPTGNLYSTQPQPPYPPALGTGVSVGGGVGAGYQPPYQPYNSFSNVPSALNTAGTEVLRTIQPTHIRDSLISAIEDKIRARLREKIGRPFAELQSVEVNLQELRLGQQKLKEMLENLERDQTQLDIIITTYQDKKIELEKALATCNTGEGSTKADIDAAIDATTPLHRQIVDCYAHDCAIDDTIYFMGQALKRGIINIQTYLKYVRQLSRKQFIYRATMQKCRLKAKLPI